MQVVTRVPLHTSLYDVLIYFFCSMVSGFGKYSGSGTIFGVLLAFSKDKSA